MLPQSWNCNWIAGSLFLMWIEAIRGNIVDVLLESNLVQLNKTVYFLKNVDSEGGKMAGCCRVSASCHK